MLNILADALLVATRFKAPASHDRDLLLHRPTQRTWAQIIGFKR